QTEQLGTGHAVMQARDVIRRARRHAADVYVILNGDTPLLREETVHALLDTHRRYKAGVTLLTANVEDPRGYGRIIRGDGNRVLRIVEDRDATKAEIAVKEINVGTYVVDGPFLFEALDKLQPENAQREYYLTDIVKFAVERRVPVAAHVVPDPDEGLGINSRQQLADAERIMRTKIVRQWLEAGVTMRDPNTTVIDADVQIGQDTVLHPFVTLEGRTRIGSDCAIRSQVRIVDSVLADRVVVQDGCLIEEARLDEESVVGPFAHLRPGSVLRRGAKVGNFVEIKKAVLGEGSKANHLTYLGDAKIGAHVNIGAGTITCNYDGQRKYETVIEDDVFIGSDTQLVAPVTVGQGAVIAAGSTITQNVPPDSLAISRTSQMNKAGWVSRRRNLPAMGQAAGKPPAAKPRGKKKQTRG
ncbi:MAG TPA: bifunctional UDP-N-acetylglucosamine diphosphorylase/glucosamine-1-phosphate N-acetyltransferase GlmU, partial [Nitrospirales bacterium]|nr:bifunctional UDP-N-acetylglucosamine diphosphorylase/glucosamine-1-phosphate N-acetyltransferase GlmU [Nitrospirales bacterium]